MTELKQTKNSFKFIGRVTGLDKDGAFKQEITNKAGSKRNGETYRSLRIQVETSLTNKNTVQMFDYEPDVVYLWDSKKKETVKVPFGQWEGNEDYYKNQGLACLSSRIGLEYGEDGKLKSKGVHSFQASEEIFNNLSNGDFVVVEGDIRYSTYKNREDKEVEQKTYTIKKLFKLKQAVDFEAENFEEVTYFEQEMVFVSTDIDKKEGKAYVTGRIINYDKTFHDTQMIINFKNEDGTFDTNMVKLADAFNKKFKFGDVINVFGDALNRVIVDENAEAPDDDDTDLFAEFGGKAKPKHTQGYVQRTYISEMQINGVDKWDKSVYEEQDFIKQELIDKDNPFADELGGKSKKKNNPFDIGDDSGISEEDLPF